MHTANLLLKNMFSLDTVEVFAGVLNVASILIENNTFASLDIIIM